MLVYVRRSDIHKYMRPIEPEEIPEVLRERFEQEQEQEEAKKREKQEAHLFVTVKVSTLSLTLTCIFLVSAHNLFFFL